MTPEDTRTAWLVVQHPALADDTVTALAAALGAMPAIRGPGVARWNGSTLPTAALAPAAIAALAERFGVDAARVPAGARLADYRLLAFDMDSTLITIECIDEIADFAGCKAEVAAITEAAMRGDIADYDESLRRRVALLAGLDAGVLERVYAERLQLSPGAERLIAAARRQGLATLLVSGGFTAFTDRLRDRLGLDRTVANRLEVADGRLTGRLLGPIVNAEGKARALREHCTALGCEPGDAIAIGDGANDLRMMAVAGLSIAYRAKAVVRSRTDGAITFGGLDAVLTWLPETT